ncbi:MAG: hypothetical protein LBN39_09775 [Planctomycetaceae bacterium]|nr:hypothetical protein [Planctomycetaceae bacterium]
MPFIHSFTLETEVPTFEQFMLSLQAMEEKFAKQFQERDERYAKEQEDAKRKWEAREEEARLRREAEMKDLWKSQKYMQQEVGKLGGRLGDFIAEMVRGNVVEEFRKLGYLVGSNTQKYEYWDDERKNILAEADLILLNGEVAVIVEAKLKVETKDIAHFLKQMDVIKTRPDRITAGLKLIAAIAGGVIGNSDIRFAQKSGLYVIRQQDDAFEIVPPPEGFKAKVWS